ncbi:hypothetical protein SpCBS45565_g07277 [Spizellomyces sp. 'palustris']|nr:hypothetical protein SpCBS45565_g07277 [Spizellomyces sp. 'palustris']
MSSCQPATCLESQSVECAWSTQEDARSQLQACLALLEDKERVFLHAADLTIAAQVGQHLLQANNELKESYEVVVSRLCSHCSAASAVPNPPVFSSPAKAFNKVYYSPRKPKFADCASAAEESTANGRLESPERRKTVGYPDLWSPSRQSSKSVNTHISRRSPSPLSRANRRCFSASKLSTPRLTSPSGSMSFDMSEYMESLERSNAELQAQVTSLLSQVKNANQSREKESNTHSAQMEDIRNELFLLCEEVDSLKAEKKRLRLQWLEDKKEKFSVEMEEREILDSLLLRVQEAEEEKVREATARQKVEGRLQVASKELRQLQAKVAQLEEKAEESVIRRDICTQQEVLVEQLKAQLEEIRVNYATVLGEMAGKLTPTRAGQGAGGGKRCRTYEKLVPPVNPFKELLLPSTVKSHDVHPKPMELTSGQDRIYDRVDGMMRADLEIGNPRLKKNQKNRMRDNYGLVQSGKSKQLPKLCLSEIESDHSSGIGDDENATYFTLPQPSGVKPPDVHHPGDEANTLVETSLNRDNLDIASRVQGIAPSNGGSILLNFVWRFLRKVVIGM